MTRIDINNITLDKGAHDPGTGMCVMDKCQEWSGRRDQNGYGRASGNRRAHRSAWEKANGPIPPGMVIMHMCDNPPCVNLTHLRLGTVAENNADRAAKGRSRGTFASGPEHPATRRRGERHWQAKLSDADVSAIRQERTAGVSCQQLALRYGVHHSTISRIGRGVWR